MTDYTKLVEALRERQGLLCYGEGACPENCELLMNHGCYTKLHMDAAAAIEDMEKHITEMHERVTVLQIARGELERENEKLKDDLEEQKQIAKHYEQSAKDWWKEAKEYYAIASAKDITAEESEELIRQFKKIPCGLIEPLEPKRGEWIVKGANRIDCSVCGHSVCFAFGLSDGSFDLYKYCPECGAKMEVQE